MNNNKIYYKIKNTKDQKPVLLIKFKKNQIYSLLKQGNH